MNISDYTFFNVLAKELNISRAAEKLYISPQALSKRIIKLENYYGTTFFERKPKFRLTYAGERLLQYYNDLALLEAKAMDEIRDIASKNQGQIRIGISPVRSTKKLSEVFIEYTKKYPHVQIVLVDDHLNNLLKELLDRKIDIIISVSTIDSYDVQHTVIGTENSYLFISDGCMRKYCGSHYDRLIRAEKDSEPVSLYEFSKCPFVLQDSETRARQKINNVFSGLHIDPKVIFSANNIDLRMDIVKNGIGVTIVDSSPNDVTRARHLFDFPNVHCFSLLELPNTTSVKVTYMKERYIPQYTKDLVDMLKEYY